MTKSDKYPKRDFKTSKDWHIYHVYNDPEFILDFEAIDINSDDTSSIKHKWGLNNYDLYYFDMRSVLFLNKNIERKGSMSYDINTRKFNLEFDPSISEAEFKDIWDEFAVIRDKMVGKPTTKRKPPENHELIYAIFKAKRHFTFPEIYRMYSDGTLPEYKGSTPDYMNEDKLEDYYRKYKPDNG